MTPGEVLLAIICFIQSAIIWAQRHNYNLNLTEVKLAHQVELQRNYVKVTMTEPPD